QPDPPDRLPVDGDHEGMSLSTRAFDVLGDVLVGERPVVVHVPPHLGVVLPVEDQRVVLLLDGTEDDALAGDHPEARLLPRTSPYTDRTSAAVVSQQYRRARATAASPILRPIAGPRRIRRMRPQ